MVFLNSLWGEESNGLSTQRFFFLFKGKGPSFPWEEVFSGMSKMVNIRIELKKTTELFPEERTKVTFVVWTKIRIMFSILFCKHKMKSLKTLSMIKSLETFAYAE